MKSIEVQLQEAQEQIKTLTVENGQLKEAVSAGKIATAKVERASMLKESKLPEPCVARIDGAFAKSADNAGLKEAINIEAEYVKSLRGPATKHNGSGDNGNITEADASQVKIGELQKRQFDTYVAGGMKEAEASAMSGYKPKK